MGSLIDFSTNLIEKLKPHAHEIFIGAGVATGVASTVEACIATRKLDKAVEPYKKKIEALHAEFENNLNSPEYKEGIKEAYKGLFVTVAKLYWKSAALTGTAVCLILKGTDISNNKIAGLTTSLLAYEEYVRRYRNRVAKVIGKEEERYLYNDIKTREVVETRKDSDGNVRHVVKKEKYRTNASTGMFERIFSPEYSVVAKADDMFFNKEFLKQTLAVLNDRGWLMSTQHNDAYITFNEVLTEFGFPKVPEGNLYGWRFAVSDKTPYKSRVIDIGLDDILLNNAANNARYSAIFLSFNVDPTPLVDVSITEVDKLAGDF